MSYAKLVEVMDMSESEDDGREKNDCGIRRLGKYKKGYGRRAEKHLFGHWSLTKCQQQVSGELEQEADNLQPQDSATRSIHLSLHQGHEDEPNHAMILPLFPLRTEGPRREWQ